ncbi:MAG: hypothetical protein KF802_07445 [Bdellovibrionaceae bacterium]|nr:hypothetical protein [Pseudobdellovibrionaceae bacterium]MBX3032994.1 hypothetical protein [Pseudobdellovibrionaceae bacterium]
MRGGLSYVTMMVLNPIIILFYQNCSVLPAQKAMAQKPAAVHAAERAPASAAQHHCSPKSAQPCLKLAE